MNCKDCKFFQEFYSGANSGLCRRHSPAIGQPEVILQDWCGEFLPNNRVHADAEEVAASTGSLQASALPTSQAEVTPPQRG